MSEFLEQPSSLTEEKQRIWQETYEPLESMVADTILRITKQEPTLWLKAAYRRLRALQQEVAKENLPPAIREYFSNHLAPILQVLQGEFRIPANYISSEERLQFVNERARVVIHEVSDLLLLERKAEEPIGVRHQSLEAILNTKLNNGYALRLNRSAKNGITNLDVYSPARKEWFSFPVPPTNAMVHKGGFPRVVLKLLSGAPPELIESELPPNDLDIIAWGDESKAYNVAAQIGVDLSGVETLKTEKPDFPELLRTRDIDLNSCFLGQDGLFYSDASAKAAATGHISPLPAFRGIYGTNMLSYQGELLYSGRDMMRTVKFVSEGKAISFSFKELNKQIDIGIYALVLAEKFLRKSSWETLLAKMFYLLQQMGQVKQDETDIWSVLERLHANYPFLEMEDRGLPDDTEVGKWLLGKLGKQALRRFRGEYSIPSLLELERKDEDTLSRQISLEGYSPRSRNSSQDNLQKRDEFLFRCRQRNRSAEVPAL